VSDVASSDSVVVMSLETTTAERTDTDEVVLDITEEALSKVIDVRDADDSSEPLALRVAVTGIQGVEYSYELSVDPVSEAADDDAVYSVGDLVVVVPADSIDKLTGATLDLPSNPVQGGLVIRNPNRPNPLEGMTIELTGTVEEKLAQLLTHRINPALESHGGSAELLRLEESTAYILMGGGCQGCAMSAATLREGITVMITEAIPEITEVIDATDHAEGENPYFE